MNPIRKRPPDWRDPKAAALRKVCSVHGNTKPRPLPPYIDMDRLFALVRRETSVFSVDTLRSNVDFKPGCFRRVFGMRYRSPDFPENLRAIYEEAWTRAIMPKINAPWTEYLLTLNEAEVVFCRGTGRKPHYFRRLLKDGEIPHYCFCKRVRRFRREELEVAIRQYRRLY